MKIYRLFAAIAAVILLFASCAKDIDFEHGAGNARVIHVTAIFDDETKTAIDDNTYKVTWQAGDKVTFYSKGLDPQECTVVADGASAAFDVLADEYLNAVYGAGVKQSGKRGIVLTDAVKPIQNGSFADAHVSIAHSSNLSTGALAFKNVTSMVRFKVTAQDVAYVRILSRNNTQLGGDVQVIFTDSNAISSLEFTGDNAIYSIRVNTVDKSGYFYASLLPGTYENGLEVRCYDANGKRVASAVSKKTLVLPFNKVLDMGTLEDHLAPEAVDLSTLLGEQITANCYIAPGYADYKFPVLCKGNSKDWVSIDEPASVDVLWESYGTISQSIQPGGVISDISYGEDYVYITTAHDGSALIAVRDEDGTILWTWYIWVWNGYDIMSAAQPYYNDAGSLMDRNLGATTAEAGEPGARGMLYQWGRKDPFLGAGANAASGPNIKEKHTLVKLSDTPGNLMYATNHPMSFIYSDSDDGDWLATHDATLWSSTKTKYDPCPPGWRVPDETFWKTALKGKDAITKTFDRTLLGTDFAGNNDGYSMGAGPDIWYPASGYRDYKSDSATISWIQWYGFFWTTGVKGHFSYFLSMLGTQNAVQTHITTYRANGMSVRCQLEFTPPPVEVEKVELKKHELTLDRYETEALEVVVTPSYSSNIDLHWESSDPTVATVSSEGVVTAVKQGTCVITVYQGSVSNKIDDNLSDTCSITVNKDQLTVFAPANCFIVTKPGQYRFDATIKGNGTAHTINPAFKKILWMSYGDTRNPENGLPIIDEVSLDYDTGMISFVVPNPMQNGNAVIGVFDQDGYIAWSWHIWACYGFDPAKTQQVYYDVTEIKDDQGNVTGRDITDGPVFMDRNLGATSATKGDVHSLGLLYQWGRKDPFLGPQGITSHDETPAVSTGSFSVTSTAGADRETFSIQNPTVFIEGVESLNYDWCNTRNDNLWDNNGKKTIYDPCPAGWKVPVGGESGMFARAFAPKKGEEANKQGVFVSNHRWDFTNRCVDLSGEFGDGDIWYPYAAYLTQTGGHIGGAGQYARIWTSTPASDARASYVVFMDYGSGDGTGSSLLLNAAWHRSFAASVRCVKE